MLQYSNCYYYGGARYVRGEQHSCTGAADFEVRCVGARTGCAAPYGCAHPAVLTLVNRNKHVTRPQQSSKYHHLSSLKSYIHFHNFFTISTHHPHSPLTDFSHAFIHHSHTTGHIETPFRPFKQTSTRLCSRTIHIPTTNTWTIKTSYRTEARPLAIQVYGCDQP